MTKERFIPHVISQGYLTGIFADQKTGEKVAMIASSTTL